MSVPLRILLVTDSFPPVCGGSGWSTWELARGLVTRGHHVEVVKADARRATPGLHEAQYEGLSRHDVSGARAADPVRPQHGQERAALGAPHDIPDPAPAPPTSSTSSTAST